MQADERRRSLCAHLDIVSEIGRRVPVKITGQHHRCACPRHDDPTLPLYIHPVDRVFTCFGCGFTGDVVDFVAEVDGVSPSEAMEALCDSLGINGDELADGGPGSATASLGESARALLLAGLDLGTASRRLNVTPEEFLASLAESGSATATIVAPSPKPAAEEPKKKGRPKEERDKELAAITSQENLRLAWRKVKMFAEEHDVYFDSKLFELYEERLECSLYLLRDRLVEMAEEGEAYRPDPFRHLRLTKPKGGHRDIAIMAGVEDRIVIQAVMNVLAPKIERGFSPNSFGHRLANQFLGNDLVFQRWPELWGGYRAKLQKFLWTPDGCAYVKGDIASFYDKVDRHRLYDLVAEYVADDWTLSTIKNYLDYRLLLDNGTVEASGPLGLPQGPAYAHFLANLYLDEFDRFVEQEVAPDQDALVTMGVERFMGRLDELLGTEIRKHTPPKRGGRQALGYCRYVDDFFILFGSREEAERWKVEIEKKLAELGLELSGEKTDIYDHSDVEPVVQEMKSRKYTVGKLLDNDESLSVEEREALYEVVETDFLTMAVGEDPGKAAGNIGFVVNKLSESTFFERNREALLSLVLEVLFSESVKHSVIGAVLKRTLPQIVRTHFAAAFVEHLRYPGTPDFKRVLFLQAVQQNGFFDELGNDLQECVRGFLESDCFFVRFAAVNCLWANGQQLSYGDVRKRYKREKHPEIQGRLLHLMKLDSRDPGNAAVFLENVARDNPDTNYHALVAARGSPLALPRVLRCAKVNEDRTFVEWLYAVLRCGGREAVESLNGHLDSSAGAERVEAVYKIMLGQAYQMYETGALLAASILELMDNLERLTNQRIRDVLFSSLLVPIRERLANTEENDDLCERLAVYSDRALQENKHLSDILRGQGPGSASEDAGFLGDVGLTYRAYRRADGTLDLWELVDVQRIIENGHFKSAYDWEEFLRRAKKKGLTDFEQCQVLCDSAQRPTGVRVHYRLGPEYRRAADRVNEKRLDEFEAAAVITATARAHVALRMLAKGRVCAPAITSYNVAVDVSNKVKLIGMGSAFCRPRYVSLDRRTVFEDAMHWDSLFLGWLSFELVTGQCPLAEAKRLGDEDGKRKYLTSSAKLVDQSIFYLRVLKRLTYESSEYRSSLADTSVLRLLAEYGEDLERLRAMERSGAPVQDIMEHQLLSFWERRVVDTWRNPSFSRQETESKAFHAYKEAREGTESFSKVRRLSLGELPSTEELLFHGLHLLTAGVDCVLRRVEEMQSRLVPASGESVPVRFNLCVMHLVLRCEAMACAFAFRHMYWGRWRQNEAATRFLQCGERAKVLSAILLQDDSRLSGVLRKEALVPLAVDLAILASESEQYSPFEKCGLAALAGFCHLMVREGEGGTETREMLFRLASFEHRIERCLGNQERLTTEVYREMGAEQQSLLELLRQIPKGRERHHGTLGDNLGPFTTHKVAMDVEGLQRPVDVGRQSVLALGSQSLDRNLTKGETVSVDVVGDDCVALSRLGVQERKLFSLTAPKPAVGPDEGGSPAAAPTPDEPQNVFYKDGSTWTIRYDGKQVMHMEDMHGLFYLSLLLSRPNGEPISCLELRSRLFPAPPPRHRDFYANMSDEELANEGLFAEVHGGEKVIAEEAKREIQERQRAYQDNIEEFQSTGRLSEAGHEREKLDQLTDYMRNALGLGGEVRKPSKLLERARQAVQKSIVRARDRFKRSCPELNRHLFQVDTSHACRYLPEHPIVWKTVKED